MKERITDERWNLAQIGEKRFHEVNTIQQSYDFYQEMYNYYFKYLDIQKNLNGKSILEIGPARISGLLFCENYSKSYVIEPTFYDGIDYLYEGKNIEIIRKKAEECDFPKIDEIWILNLLQHVQDPDIIIKKCKESGKIIKFFEPIEYEINNEHSFYFTKNDYIEYFGDSVRDYVHPIPKFHQAKCVYGIYENKELL
jgi:2-polyprenyl-3-methyl-5-hydroxy-6-metoxy-1,4-benzoquinol methylase